MYVHRKCFYYFVYTYVCIHRKCFYYFVCNIENVFIIFVERIHMYVYIVNGFIILFHIYDTYVCIHSKCFYYFVSHILYICMYT